MSDWLRLLLLMFYASARGMGEASKHAWTQRPSDEDVRLASEALPRLLLWQLIQPLTLFSLWAVAAVRAVFRLDWWRSVLVVVLAGVLTFFAQPLLFVFSTLLA